MGWISEEQVAAAREIDLLTYLENSEPQELVHSAPGEFRTAMHGSLVISKGKWYWNRVVAVRKAYPPAKKRILESYMNDSICGTWEVLADAVYSGGQQGLSQKGWQSVGCEKYKWARAISPHMDVDANASPSFQFLCAQLNELLDL